MLRSERASAAKTPTQMGNQGHADEGYRRLCEYIWSGAIGEVRETHSWTNRANGKIKLRLSRDGGRTFKPAQTLGTSGLSIDCKKRVTDGLVGLVAADRWLHVAWSQASKGRCQASAIKVRSSSDRGKKWSPRRTITDRRSYGWPELDARGRTVIASVQSPTGGVIVSRSTKNGRNWRDHGRRSRRPRL